MSGTFVEVVEEVKRLSTDEKLELKDLIDSYLVEERRAEILQSYENSKSEHLEFSGDRNVLQNSLNDSDRL